MTKHYQFDPKCPCCRPEGKLASAAFAVAPLPEQAALSRVFVHGSMAPLDLLRAGRALLRGLRSA